MERQRGNQRRDYFSVAQDSYRRAGLKVFALDIAEGDGEVAGRGKNGAGHPPDLLFVRANHAAALGRLISFKNQSDKLSIDMATGANPLHHLLPQIATFLKTHG